MRRPDCGQWAMLVLLGTPLVLAGCGGGGNDPDAATADLARYPGAEQQIRAYYASQGAGEPNFSCGRGTIARIDQSHIVTDTPIEVVFQVTYRFAATSLGASNAGCEGTSTRWFTFDREGDGRLALAEMADDPP